MGDVRVDIPVCPGCGVRHEGPCVVPDTVVMDRAALERLRGAKAFYDEADRSTTWSERRAAEACRGLLDAVDALLRGVR